MIHFRTRKHGSHINSSYFLKDGQNMGDLSSFLIGDRVDISWPCNTEKRAALENIDPRLIGDGFYATDAYTEEIHIYTPCIVAERRRNLARFKGDVADLRDFGLTITLEAVNGYVEDMLIWIMFGEKPKWAE